MHSIAPPVGAVLAAVAAIVLGVAVVFALSRPAVRRRLAAQRRAAPRRTAAPAAPAPGPAAAPVPAEAPALVPVAAPALEPTRLIDTPRRGGRHSRDLLNAPTTRMSAVPGALHPVQPPTPTPRTSHSGAHRARHGQPGSFPGHTLAPTR